MRTLFDTTRDFDDDAYRNIVSLRESVDLFAELTDGNPLLSELAAHAEMRVKAHIPAGMIERGFHYSTAIGYPFTSEPYLISRYGTGNYGVWYGSLEYETAIFETARHMLIEERRREGAGPVIRERAVYQVHCRAILIDLTGKKKAFPDLVADDYSLTHQIGERLQREGHPGLLSPSARCPGINLTVFTPAVLSQPRLHSYLTYYCDPGQGLVRVERHPGVLLLQVTA